MLIGGKYKLLKEVNTLSISPVTCGFKTRVWSLLIESLIFTDKGRRKNVTNWQMHVKLEVEACDLKDSEAASEINDLTDYI